MLTDSGGGGTSFEEDLDSVAPRSAPAGASEPPPPGGVGLGIRTVRLFGEAGPAPGVGGGGGGGGGSSSSSSSGGSSGGRSGSSGSSSGSGSSGRTSSSSNRGGSTRGGSGVSPGYGGGSYYAGGAKTPYSAGGRSPGGISPYLLPLGALAIFPGLWLAGAYAYSYNHPYYYNHNGRNDSLPVTCLCEKYQECGCEDNNNQTYYQDLFNGTEPRNGSNVRVADVNGTKTILINGTLPNGTTASTSAGPGSMNSLINISGYWLTVAIVVATVWTF